MEMCIRDRVKIGSQVKQIVSGIKAHYTPEEMAVSYTHLDVYKRQTETTNFMLA